MQALAEELSAYGTVTLPDLPGFGGMDPFYKIGQTPTLDAMADYMAAFVKLRYNRKRLTIVAMSYGFLVATRMLQRCPELAKKVDVVTSVVGFAHKNDFKFKKSSYNIMLYGSRFFSLKFPAWFAKTFLLRAPLIKATYMLVANRHAKMKDADKAERKKRIAFEVILWKCNDLRTYMRTTVTMLTVDLCSKQVEVPLYHVAVDKDQYFDNYRVEQHLRVIYDDFHLIKTNLDAHMPTVVATPEEVAPFIPPKLRKVLQKA